MAAAICTAITQHGQTETFRVLNNRCGRHCIGQHAEQRFVFRLGGPRVGVSITSAEEVMLYPTSVRLSVSRITQKVVGGVA